MTDAGILRGIANEIGANANEIGAKKYRELHRIANNFDSLQAENEELRQALITRDGALTSKILKAENERLKEEVKKSKQPLTPDELSELEVLRELQNDATRYLSQEEFDRIHYLANKQWGNAPKEIQALQSKLDRAIKLCEEEKKGVGGLAGANSWFASKILDLLK